MNIMFSDTSRTKTDKLKKSLRMELREVRNGLLPGDCRHKSSQIHRRLLQLPEFQQAKAIFCFISIGKEVDTRAIISSACANGQLVAVPKITRDQGMLALPFTGWTALETGALGIPEPALNSEVQGVFDLTITPGLGFTREGARIGYGRGYYDNWFANFEGGLKIALAYASQIVSHIPMDKHDQTVDLIITEDETIRLGP